MEPRRRGRRPISPRWSTRAYGLFANGATNHDVYEALRAEGETEGRHDMPAETTIPAIRQRFRQLPEREQREYTEARWPESFESGALPNEAVPATLELLGNLFRTVTSRLGSQPGRPSVRFARHFWRVTAGAPDAPFSARFALAGRLASDEALTGIVRGETARAVEAWLAFHPWTSGEAAAAYLAAIRASAVPPVTATMEANLTSFTYTIEADTDLDKAAAAMVEASGGLIDAATARAGLADTRRRSAEAN